MLDKLKEDQIWTGTVILLYTLPIFLWIVASMNAMGPYRSWSLFGIGLLIAFAGSTALILLKRPKYPEKIEPLEIVSPPAPAITPVPFASPPPSFEVEELKAKLHSLQDQAHDVQKLQDENTALKNQNFQVIHAYNSLKKEMEEFQARSESNNPETASIIEKQNELLQNYQAHVVDLENKIEELKYEMRAIMNLNENDLEEHLSEDEILRSSG